MIIQAFLRWVETAKTADRARAACALAKAYAGAEMNRIDRHAAEMAMTFLLDDPSPKVRLALSEELCTCSDVPRSIVLSLAEDQPEIAFAMATRSPALTNEDLVELVAHGTAELRAFIALRKPLARSVSAAIAEIGGEAEVLILLENDDAAISRRTLKRLADRLGDGHTVRNALLDRADLPADARQALVEKIGAALSNSPFVGAAIGEVRLRRVAREACDAAIVEMAGSTDTTDLPELVEQLRATARLTPGLLLNALCLGRIDFFAAAMVGLTSIREKRVRSILSDGGRHALRALFEAAGLGRDIAALFSEAMLIWRRESRIGNDHGPSSIVSILLPALRDPARAAGLPQGLRDTVEKLAIVERRRVARDYALLAARQAA